jgi:hypothetical protein
MIYKQLKEAKAGKLVVGSSTNPSWTAIFGIVKGAIALRGAQPRCYHWDGVRIANNRRLLSRRSKDQDSDKGKG